MRKEPTSARKDDNTKSARACTKNPYADPKRRKETEREGARAEKFTATVWAAKNKKLCAQDDERQRDVNDGRKPGNAQEATPTKRASLHAPTQTRTQRRPHASSDDKGIKKQQK